MKTQIKKPKASIIIVNFNNAKYLSDCINSILKQSYNNKEINFYKYNLVKSPYFFTQDVVSLKVFKKNNFEIYSPKNQMCWASKTPCSYHRKFNHTNFLWMNVVSRDNR